jgi:hypothetical protein
VCVAAHVGTPLVDCRKRQTATATPAEPGGLPLTLDLRICNARLRRGGEKLVDIAITDGRIVAIGEGVGASARDKIDAEGVWSPNRSSIPTCICARCGRCR